MIINELKNDIDVYLSYSNLLDNNHEVVFLSESKSNINFLIDAESEKYLFRLNKFSELGLRNQIRYEYDALKTLEKSYVTPTTFFLDDSNTFFDYGALIMQFIEGRTLDYENKKDIQEAAKIIATIHSLDTNKFDISSFIVRDNIIKESLKISKENLDGFLECDIIDIKVKLKINELLQWAEKNKYCARYFEKDKWLTINNTKPTAENFIISKRKRKGFLIDWEKPVVADPSVDVAYFLSPLTTFMSSNYIFTQNEKDDFFKTYIMYLDKCDRDIVERVRVYTPFLYLESLSKIVNKFRNMKNSDDVNYRKLKKILTKDFLDELLKGII